MNSRITKMRAAAVLFSTKPHPFFFTAVFVLIVQLIQLIVMEVGGQPLMIDTEAAMAGRTADIIQFVPQNVTPSSGILLIAAEILLTVVSYGYYSYILHAVRREKCAIMDITDGFFILFRAIVLSFVKGLLVFTGLTLFIVPGLFFRYVYSQAELLLIDNPDWSPFKCMRESRAMMRGHVMEYFRLRLSLLLWSLMSVFAFVQIFSRPYITMCEAVYYQMLNGELTSPDLSDDDQDGKPPWEY